MNLSFFRLKDEAEMLFGPPWIFSQEAQLQNSQTNPKSLFDFMNRQIFLLCLKTKKTSKSYSLKPKSFNKEYIRTWPGMRWESTGNNFGIV